MSIEIKEYKQTGSTNKRERKSRPKRSREATHRLQQ